MYINIFVSQRINSYISVMLFCKLYKSRINTEVKVKLHGRVYDGTIVKDRQYYGGKKIIIPMVQEGDEEIYGGDTHLSYKLYKKDIIG